MTTCECCSASRTSPGPAVELERDLVRHRRGRQEDRALLAEQLGDALLQLVDARILALLLVADLGCGDRGAHAGRRPGGGVGAEIDHGQSLRRRRRPTPVRAPPLARVPAATFESMIVIGVDGSPAAKEALRYGLHEASIRGTRVRAVHVWSPTAAVPMTGPGLVAPDRHRLPARGRRGSAADDSRGGRGREGPSGRARPRRRAGRRGHHRVEPRRRADRRRAPGIRHREVDRARLRQQPRDPARDLPRARDSRAPRWMDLALLEQTLADRGEPAYRAPPGVGVGRARRRRLRRDDERPGAPPRRARRRRPVLDAHGRPASRRRATAP